MDIKNKGALCAVLLALGLAAVLGAVVRLANRAGDAQIATTEVKPLSARTPEERMSDGETFFVITKHRAAKINWDNYPGYRHVAERGRDEVYVFKGQAATPNVLERAVDCLKSIATPSLEARLQAGEGPMIEATVSDCVTIDWDNHPGYRWEADWNWWGKAYVFRTITPTSIAVGQP